MKSTTPNTLGLIFAIVLALATWILSPEFVFDQFGFTEQTFGIMRFIATLVSVVIGAYNGYQIAEKRRML